MVWVELKLKFNDKKLAELTRAEFIKTFQTEIKLGRAEVYIIEGE